MELPKKFPRKMSASWTIDGIAQKIPAQNER